MNILADIPNHGKPQLNQKAFFDNALNSSIGVRLLDGKVFEGRLIAHDKFCLFLLPKNNAVNEPVLIFKHAVAYIAPVQGEK